MGLTRAMTRLYVPIQLRWSDLDAYGHVNNVEMFRILEEARIQAFWKRPEAVSAEQIWPTAVIESGPQAESLTFVAHQQIEYLRPLGFARHPMRVELWISRMAGAALDVCYEVHDDGAETARSGPGTDARPVVRAMTTIVLVSATTGAPRRLTTEERAAWEPYVEAPVTFRYQQR